jgi:hypothetical protein
VLVITLGKVLRLSCRLDRVCPAEVGVGRDDVHGRVNSTGHHFDKVREMARLWEKESYCDDMRGNQGIWQQKAEASS